MKKRFFLISIIQLAILLIAPNLLASASIQTPLLEVPYASASDVISAINSYRTQNGLSALTSNSLLNSLAQSQANYQASIETVTHTGPGGTSPQDRASAAGYGNGSGFYYSEIIYGGYNANTSDAMTWWKNSSTHNYYILQSTYVEIGAGVATSGDMVYFTAVLAGMYGGSSSSGSNSTSSQGETGGTSTENNSQPAVPLVMPVQKAAPLADGSIIHTVQEGQTLWTIAAVYEIELGKLLEQNGLNNYSFVFPGDELLIRPAGTYPNADPQTTIQASNSTTEETIASELLGKPKILGTPVAYNTKPQATSTPIIINIPAHQNAEKGEQTEASPSGLLPQNSTIRIILIIAFSLLFLVVVGSIFLQKPPDRDKPER